MSTLTPNYNLTKPGIGETGWGEAVNANFDTLDTALTNQNATITTHTGQIALKAPIASPTFTGTPAAPTAAASANSTQIATTAMVQAAIDAALAELLAGLTAGTTVLTLPTLKVNTIEEKTVGNGIAISHPVSVSTISTDTIREKTLESGVYYNRQNVSATYTVAASETYIGGSSISGSGTNTTYAVQSHSMVVAFTGTCRLKMKQKDNDTGSVYSRWLKNGVAVGAEHICQGTETNFVDDISVVPGDVLTLKTYHTVYSYYTYTYSVLSINGTITQEVHTPSGTYTASVWQSVPAHVDVLYANT